MFSRNSELIKFLQLQLEMGIDSSCCDSVGHPGLSLESVLAGVDGPITVLPNGLRSDADRPISSLSSVPVASQSSSVGGSSELSAHFVSDARPAVVGLHPSVMVEPLPVGHSVSKLGPIAGHGLAPALQEKVAIVRREIDDISGLDELKRYVFGFEHCALKAGATNTVFSDGDPMSKVMLIGEAPGEQEDLRGIPFCGKSGTLLDEILAAVGFDRRRNIYISNSVFWRPPANRKPTDEEVEICRPILEKHIAIIDPILIIICGGTAMEAILQKTGITKLAGEFFDYTNQYTSVALKAVPIFHPAFLLRNPIGKAVVWRNMLDIREYCLQSGVAL